VARLQYPGGGIRLITMGQRKQFIMVFSMLLMLCGQTLASALMWCCPAAGAAVVGQPARLEASLQMAMTHMKMPHREMQHHHAPTMPVTSTPTSLPMDHASALPPTLANLLDCGHSCTSSCSNTAALVVPLAPPAFVVCTRAVSSAVPALPQTDPSLPFRPPNAA
jgi:hypothetical protein